MPCSQQTQLLFWLTGACYYDSNQSMYVFGGCTQSSCNAAFNDLWRLDLNSKEWIRPLASGTGPLLPVKPAGNPPHPFRLMKSYSCDCYCKAGHLKDC